MTEYAIVIEDAGGNLSAYVPDLSGCVATGDSIDSVTSNIKAALAMRIESLREHGEEVPAPTSRAASVQIS